MREEQQDAGASIAEQLAAADERYQNVGEGPDGPPPGLYKFQLVSAELKPSAAGKLLIVWKHVVLEGEHQSEELVDFSQPTSEKSFPIRMMRQRIAALEWPAPTNLMDLEELVPEINKAGPIYIGLVKHSGNYANLEIKSLIQQYGAASGQRPEAAAGNDATTAATATEFQVNDRVSFTDKGNTFKGVVKSVSGDDLCVKIDGEKDDAVGAASEFALVSRPGNDAAGSSDEGEQPEQGLDELIAFAIAQGYDIPEGSDAEFVVGGLKDETWNATDLTDDEVALLGTFDVPVVAKPKASKPKAAKKAAKKAKKKAKKAGRK